MIKSAKFEWGIALLLVNVKRSNYSAWAVVHRVSYSPGRSRLYRLGSQAQKTRELWNGRPQLSVS